MLGFVRPSRQKSYHRRITGGWEAESFLVTEVVSYTPPTQNSLCARTSALRASVACAQSLLFPEPERETSYQIFINTSVFFSKSQNSPQHQKTFRLRRKDFCPSGSRCFDKYLCFFKTPPTQQSQYLKVGFALHKCSASHSGGFTPTDSFCIRKSESKRWGFRIILYVPACPL